MERIACRTYRERGREKKNNNTQKNLQICKLKFITWNAWNKEPGINNEKKREENVNTKRKKNMGNELSIYTMIDGIEMHSHWNLHE